MANILKRHGIEPAPERGRCITWKQFLSSHGDVLSAGDFFTIEVWGLRLLVTFYVFFVIELAPRRIQIAAITPGPSENWMLQSSSANGRSSEPTDSSIGGVACRDCLGEMLRFYSRPAA